MRLILGILAAVVMGLVWFFAEPSASQAPGVERFWVKVVFGTDRTEASWDGQLRVKGGRLLDIAEWGLEERDKLLRETFSWQMTTGIPPVARVTYAEPMRGFLVEVEAAGQTTLEVETKQGNFTFEPAALNAGRPKSLLNGRAQVERLGTGALVAETTTDDDFASIAIDGRGQRHVLWIAFDPADRRNHLLMRNVDDPKSKPEPIARATEFTSAHLFTRKDGAMRAVWCSPGDKEDWDIYVGTRDPQGWKVERVTGAKGTDFQLAADQAADGSLWIAWQSFRNGNADIYAQCLRNGRWLPNDVPVATGPANEWQPALHVDATGRAWVGFDSYENGNYDVFLTSIVLKGDKFELGERIAVAQSPDFEAHASLLSDATGRVWVAYDAAGPNWGKDFRNGPTEVNGQYGEPLHASRRIELRCVKDGKVYEPQVAFPQDLPPRPLKNIDRKPTALPTRFYEYPQLARDGEGRMWVLFRLCRQGYCPHPPRGIDWSIHATTFTTKGWVEPIQLPRSQGRQEQRVAFAVGPDKFLHCAWADGNRFASVDRKYGVYFGRLPRVNEPAADLPFALADVATPKKHDPIAKVPWTLRKGGKDYHLYFGDLHRHTNISRCSPTVDGCLTDAHRYALDAVGLDFLAITDHTRDVDPFSWWRTQQAADHYHIPRQYVPIYAYERSNNAPTGGHRNVFFLKRGWDVNPSDAWYTGRNLKPKDTRPDTTLYPWLKQGGEAFTIAHTPVYAAGPMKGTWTYNDPQVEPVAEIYQSFRRSYERPDKGVPEQAALWGALNRGHRLGFIASSDHLATHTSYACVWATEKTRPAIFEGLQARRTFGATDRIVLDTRIGEALMGEEIRLTGGEVKLGIRAQGTAPIEEIQIVRSGAVVGRLHPNKSEVNAEYVDREPLAGESYYYVRLLQRDGGMAWASPIWIKR